MALTDLTRISTSGIATGSTIDSPILRKDVSITGVTTIADDVKLKFGNGGDLEIFHRTVDGVSNINEYGSAYLSIGSNGSKIELYDLTNARSMAEFFTGGACSFKHGDTTRFQTTSTGAVVTGVLTASSYSGPISNPSGISTFYDVRVTNNLTVEGTTTTLDTDLIGVDRVEVAADSNSIVGVAITQSGTADILNLYDGSTEVVSFNQHGNLTITNANPIINFIDSNNDSDYRIQVEAGSFLIEDLTNNHHDSFVIKNTKIGINDNNPERTLDVVGNNAMIQIEGSGGNGRQYSLCSTDDTTGAAVGSAGQFVIYDDTSGSNRLTITSDGKVGINQSTPLAGLHVGTVSGINTAFQVGTISGTNRYLVINHIHNQQNFYQVKMRCNDNQLVPILDMGNPYGSIGHGTKIKFSGYGDNEVAAIEVINKVANSSSVDMVFNTGGTNERLRIGSTGNTTITTQGDTVADSFSLKVGQANENSNSGSGPHYGLLVNQLGARYHLNIGVYSEVLGTNGLYTGMTFDGMTKMRSIGVVGISTVSSEAYQKGIGVYGKVLLNNYNYNDVYGVKGLARPGTDGFSNNDNALNYAGYGGHFVAHGKGQSIGVYADAYLDGSPGANQEAIPLKVASNGTELMRVSSGGQVRIANTDLTTSNKSDDLIVGTTSGDRGITIFSGSGNTGNIYFADTDTSGVENRMGTITYVHSENYMRFSTSGNKERLRISSTGDVGIGTNGYGIFDPLAPLHVCRYASTDEITSHTTLRNASTLILQTSNNVNNSRSGILFNGALHPTDGCSAGIIANHENVAENSESTSLSFYTTHNESLGERLRIFSDGKIVLGQDATNNAHAHVTIHGSDTEENDAVSTLVIADTASYNHIPQMGITFKGHYHSNGAMANFAGIVGKKQNNGDGQYGGELYLFNRTHLESPKRRITLDADGVARGSNGCSFSSLHSAKYYNTYDSAGWTAGTFEDVIPTGTLGNGKTYLISFYWTHHGSGAPYLLSGSFLFRPNYPNGTGEMGPTHIPFQTGHTSQGISRYFEFAPFGDGYSGSQGIRVQTVGWSIVNNSSTAGTFYIYAAEIGHN